MADKTTLTGSRDDLVVDVSRCLKMRYSESSCRSCIDICPNNSISMESILTVDPTSCSGCLLCTAVCPSGALELSGDFPNTMSQLSRVPAPILGCVRTKEHSNATLACLGGLSAEHLMTLCHKLSGKLTLNLTACCNCPNGAIIIHLRQLIEELCEAELLEGGCDIVMTESTKDISYRDESVDRRSFFKSFRNSLFQSAAVILTTNNEPTERRTDYAVKRLPVRRQLLNDLEANISLELSSRIGRFFNQTSSFEDNCTGCQGCAAICPTGALQTLNSDTHPEFAQSACTGCGLCQEFCMDHALHINPNTSLHDAESKN